MMAMTITLATVFRAIMLRISTAQTKTDATNIFSTPNLFTTKPGARRPKKLDAFRITSCVEKHRRSMAN